LGIRGKLFLLAVGIAVPLVVVGALDLRNMWRLSRSQLNDSVKQQVELASVALDRWLIDQKRGLDAIAALAGDKDTRTPIIREYLENVLGTRPFWLDLRITNAAGTTLMAQPSRKEILPNALTDYVVSKMRERNSWAVVTDRTVDEARPLVIIAVPIQKGGAVIARIDGAAINQLFDGIQLSSQVVISVVDSEGRVLYRRRGSDTRYPPTSEGDISWAPRSSVLTNEQTNVVELTSPIDGINRVYGIASVRESGLVAMIGIPSSTLYEPARQRLIRYTITGLIALLLAFGAALVIERSIVLPVRRLRGAAQRLGGGDLSARAPRLGGGEIGDLGLKSEFVSSVSHELKTPLTTIKLLAHVLQRRDVAEEEKLDYSKTIAIECDRQIDFVGNLLDLSRIESGAYKLRKTSVNVREVISSCVNVERPRAESLGLTLTTDIPADLSAVSGDFEALRRVIRGLIDNAIKYTPEGGRITVSAREIENGMAISVSDTGKGIPETDLPHIFSKFYRVIEEGASDSSGTAAPGVGLGLYLAQHIVSQMEGQIDVESKQGVGTTFIVTLPFWIDEVAAKGSQEETHVKALVGS
jgi:signal transduction histidine kinase